MKLYRFDIKLKGAFATPPKGDTFFGQFCWQIVQNRDSSFLEELLDGYTANRPFAIFSDILPQNRIQKPPIPDSLFGIAFDPKKRKEIKAKNIIDLEKLKENKYLYNKEFILKKVESQKDFKVKESIVVRNSINRLTFTTDKGFDPFANYRFDYQSDNATFYLMLDERLSIEDTTIFLEQIGQIGFGKDSSVGRGKYDIIKVSEYQFDNNNTNALITLSPSILSNQGFTQAWYNTFTRFGKHGNYLTHSLVWKNPILMADSFALIKSEKKEFIGQGLGGDGKISKALPQTVHQGYAITIPVTLEVENETFFA